MVRPGSCGCGSPAPSRRRRADQRRCSGDSSAAATPAPSSTTRAAGRSPPRTLSGWTAPRRRWRGSAPGPGSRLWAGEAAVCGGGSCTRCRDRSGRARGRVTGTVAAGSPRGGRARRPRSRGERSCPFEPTGRGKRLSESACWTGSTRGSRRARANERSAWSRGERLRRGAPPRVPRHTPATTTPRATRPRLFHSRLTKNSPTKKSTTSRLTLGAGSSGTSGTRCAPSATPQRPDITRPSPTRRCTLPTGQSRWTTPTTTCTCWRWCRMSSTSPGWSARLAARTSAPRRARWRRGWWRWPGRKRKGTRVRGWRRRKGPCSRWGASTRRKRTKATYKREALHTQTRV